MTIGHFAIQELRGDHWRYEDDNVAKPHTIEIVALYLILGLSFVRTTFDLSFLMPSMQDSCAILYTSLTGSVVIASFARVRTICALGSD